MKLFLLLMLLLPNPQAVFDAWLADPRLQGAHVGFEFVRLRDGQTLAQHDAQKVFTPASTMKVLTAWRILQHPHEPLETKLWQDGTDLYLQGAGDPELTTQDLLAMTASGAARLFVDPGLNVTEPLGVGWAWDDVTEDFSAEICGLTVDHGVEPADSLELIHLDGAGYFDRLPGRAGTRAMGAATGSLAVSEPDLVAGQILARHLKLPLQGRAPARGTVVATHRSRPVNEMLREALARSDNLAMELLLRVTAGQEAATDLAPRVVDACGLSRYNLVRPHDLVQVLGQSAELRALLPLAGQQGTMKSRLPGKPVRAKTGSMSNVSSLAGTLETEEPCVFALLINGWVGPLKECKQLEDSLIEQLLAP